MGRRNEKRKEYGITGGGGEKKIRKNNEEEETLMWVIPVVLINYIIRKKNILPIWSEHNDIFSHRIVDTTTC